MLNFFKKTGGRIAGAAGGDPQLQQAATGQRLPSSASSSSSSTIADDILSAAEKFCADNPASATTTVFDDKPIVHIVTNPNALSHFVQFLDSRRDDGASLALLKFWLDADSFRTAALADNQQPTNRPFAATAPLHQKPPSTTTTLTKSLSLDDTALSAHRTAPAAPAPAPPLTDDEKSRARRCERRRFQTTLATDAVRIFRKYLTGKSAHPVEVPATLLARISLALGAGKLEADDEEEEPRTERTEATCSSSPTSRESHESTDDCCPSVALPPRRTTLALANIFRAAQRHVLATLDRQHLDEFLASANYARHCIDVLTSEALRIEDILRCQSAHFYLAEFLEQEGRRSLLEFWVAAGNFRQQCDGNWGAEEEAEEDDEEEEEDADEAGHCDLQQTQSDAVVLYDRYFSLQAPVAHRLGLSDARRSQVEQSICSRKRTELTQCFAQSRRIVERCLEAAYFRAFVTSALFGRYLAELLHKIDGPPEAEQAKKLPRNGAELPAIAERVAPSAQPQKNAARHRKTASESLSSAQADRFRRTISTQNTLLAVDTSRMALTGSSMQIDGRQLSDPEALWRRSGCERSLSFGRVTAMGRYERDFEVHSGGGGGGEAAGGDGHAANRLAGSNAAASSSSSSSSSSLMQAVRRLVRLPEDRAKEDLAWEVAEMIVRDITNVTLHGGDGGGGSAAKE